MVTRPQRGHEPTTCSGVVVREMGREGRRGGEAGEEEKIPGFSKTAAICSQPKASLITPLSFLTLFKFFSRWSRL